MAIRFRCEHCGKTVEAPDSAAGKLGRCPHCQQSNFIPAPVAEDDILPLQPIDEAEQRKLEAELRALREKEKDLLAEEPVGSPPVPLEDREDLASEELHHFVVNYCLDMAGGKLERAEIWVAKLRKFGDTGQGAVADFLGGKVKEPALRQIPPRVLLGFLTQLRDELK